MATSVEERRAQFRWMDKLSDEDVTAVALAEPGTELADLDEYVDATSPKRGRVISLEGERVPVGGVYIVKSASAAGAVGSHRRSDPLSVRYPAGMEASVATPQTVSVYVCVDGHRTLALTSIPETCHHRASRTKPYCGKPVQSLSEAPADVQQKMLNPLKASKKASKK